MIRVEDTRMWKEEDMPKRQSSEVLLREAVNSNNGLKSEQESEGLVNYTVYLKAL